MAKIQSPPPGSFIQNQGVQPFSQVEEAKSQAPNALRAQNAFETGGIPLPETSQDPVAWQSLPGMGRSQVPLLFSLQTESPPEQSLLMKPIRSGNTLLRQGANGVMVTKLQELLNKAGASLETDGKLGPLTMQAVKDFQKQHGLKVDGIVGPNTLAALEGGASAKPAGPTTGPQPSVQPNPTTTEPVMGRHPVTGARPAIDNRSTIGTQPSIGTTAPTIIGGTPAPNATAQSIINHAVAEDGMVSNNAYDGAEYHGWQHLQSTIKEATKGPLGADGKHHPPGISYPDRSIRTHPRPIWKDGSGKVHHMDWCGVWATRMFQKAGVDCYWKPGIGVQGDVKKVFSPKAEDIKPGDMIVGEGPLWHHAIVTDIIRDDTGKITGFKTMNGNHPGIGAGEMAVSRLSAYYRPTT